MSLRSKKRRRWARRLVKATAVRDAELKAMETWTRRQGAAQQVSPERVEEAVNALIVHTPESLIFRDKRRARKTGRRML